MYVRCWIPTNKFNTRAELYFEQSQQQFNFRFDIIQEPMGIISAHNISKSCCVPQYVEHPCVKNHISTCMYICYLCWESGRTISSLECKQKGIFVILLRRKKCLSEARLAVQYKTFRISHSQSQRCSLQVLSSHDSDKDRSAA